VFVMLRNRHARAPCCSGVSGAHRCGSTGGYDAT